MISPHDRSPADFPYADYGTADYWNDLFESQPADSGSLIMPHEAAQWLVGSASDSCDEMIRPLVECIEDQLPGNRRNWQGMRRGTVRALCDQVFRDEAELADVIELEPGPSLDKLVS